MKTAEGFVNRRQHSRQLSPKYMRVAGTDDDYSRHKKIANEKQKLQQRQKLKQKSLEINQDKLLDLEDKYKRTGDPAYKKLMKERIKKQERLLKEMDDVDSYIKAYDKLR